MPRKKKRTEPALSRLETPETTNTALRIILKDLDVLVKWATADADASVKAKDMERAGEDHIRARTYARCRHQLANAFKEG